MKTNLELVQQFTTLFNAALAPRGPVPVPSGQRTMKWCLSGCVMSCAIVFELRVMTLQQRSERLSVEGAIILACEVWPTCDREHDE